MNFQKFQQRAHRIFAEIPAEYRVGISGLVVQHDVLTHPDLPGIYTLGECATGELDAWGDAPGELRSLIVLYYGSFLRMSEEDDGWDWEEELWETITHEIQHHREGSAGEDDLEVLDYVHDHNFARREGAPFDPFFHRSGTEVGDGIFEVDGDVFIEVPVEPGPGVEDEIAFAWHGAVRRVRRPEPLGEVHHIAVDGLASPHSDAEVVVVLIRRRSFRESFRALFSGTRGTVLSSRAPALPLHGAVAEHETRGSNQSGRVE